jgi:hypothetical protein
LRSTLGVASLTLLLVVGAVAAAYAGLAPVSKQPVVAPRVIIAQAPVTAPAAVAPASTGATATTPAPPATASAASLPSLPVKPPATATPTTITTGAASTTPPPAAATPPASTTTTSTPTTTPAAQPLLLDTNAASSYNPYSYNTASFGDPDLAIDGDTSTAWTYTLDPTSNGIVAVGLLIDLNSPQTVGSLSVQTPSPGMAVEYYGASGTIPATITTPGWTHLASSEDIPAKSTVTLRTLGKQYRYILLWIRHAPATKTTGTVGISEVDVYAGA